MLDIILKAGRVEGYENLVDVGIKNGKIVSIESRINEESKELIECQGNIISEPFVDFHTHMEKTYLDHLTDEGTLMDAIEAFFEYAENSFSKEDVKTRARKMIEKCIENGTGFLRTHVVVDETVGTGFLESSCEIKEEYKAFIDIQIIAMMGTLCLTEEQIKSLKRAADYDIIENRGAPTLCENPFETVDFLFQLALEKNKLIDLHIDESDDANVDFLEHVIKKAKELDFEDKTTVGHITALSAVSEEKSTAIIIQLKNSKINVVTLPSCNLFLMGRGDKGLVRRGTTRIGELLDAGVNIFLASDNIRDPFRPFGNGNLLEEALLTVQVIQRGTDEDLEEVYNMINKYPMKAYGIKEYGIRCGYPANLILIDATSKKEAVLSQGDILTAIHNGNLIFKKKINIAYLGGYRSEANRC